MPAPVNPMTGQLEEHDVLGDMAEFEEMLAIEKAKNPTAPPPPEPAPPLDLNTLPSDVAEAIRTAPEEAVEALEQAYRERMQTRNDFMELNGTLRQSMQGFGATYAANTSMAATTDKGSGIQDWRRDGKDERSLKRAQEFSQSWKDTRETLSMKSNKHQNDLAMERQTLHRKKQEMVQHIENSIPLDQQSMSAEMWKLTLRNNWHRSVPVGHIFSGLFCNQYKTLDPVEVEMVRRPQLPDLPEGTTSHLPGMSTTRRWLDSKYVKDRQKEFASVMAKHHPHEVDESFEVVGQGITEVTETLALQPITLTEVEEHLARTNAEAWATMKAARAQALFEAEEAERERLAAIAEAEAKIIKGPRLEMDVKTVAFQTMPGEKMSKTVTLTNTGTTALFYTWGRSAKYPLRNITTQWEPNQASHSEFKSFYLQDHSGMILPKDSREFRFTFQAVRPGTIAEHWTVTTSPALPAEFPAGVVMLKGVCLAEDALAPDRDAVEKDLRTREMHRKIKRINDSMVAKTDVPLPSPWAGPEMLTSKPESSIFAAANDDMLPAVYYNDQVWEVLKAIFADTTELMKEPPPVLAEGEEPPPPPSPGPDEGEEPAEWSGSIVEIAGKIQDLRDKPWVKPLQVLAMSRRLDKAVADAVIPKSRLVVVQHAVYDILGDIADRIWEKEDDAVKEVEADIAAEKQRVADEKAAERARIEEEYQKAVEKAEADGEPPPEPLPEPEPEPEPEPDPPVMGTEAHIEVMHRMSLPMVSEEWDKLEDAISWEARAVAAELDQRVADIDGKGYHWVQFDLLRTRRRLMLEELREAVGESLSIDPESPEFGVYPRPDLTPMQVWGKRQMQRLEQANLRAALESVRAEDEADPNTAIPAEELSNEQAMEKGKKRLGAAFELLGDLKSNALAELKSYPKGPKYSFKVLQAILLILGGAKASQVKEWASCRKFIDQSLINKMREFDAEGKRKPKAWKAAMGAVKNLTELNVGTESMASLVLFKWVTAVAEVSDAALAARQAIKQAERQAAIEAAEAAGEEPPEEEEEEDEEEED